MNRKQRRAAARKKKIDLASAPANAGWHKDIVLAKSLYFSAHPGAGMGNNGSGAAGDVQSAGRKARELVKRRLRKNPDLWGEALGLALDLSNGGRGEDAIDICRDIVEVSSGSADALANTGAVMIQLGKFDDARDSLTRAVELDPGQADAFNSLGVLYNRSNRHDLAAEAFKKSLTARPQFIKPYVNVCYSLRQTAEWDQAKIFADMALELADYSAKYFPNFEQVYRAICDFKGLEKLGDVWKNCEHIKTENLPAAFLNLLVYAEDTESVRHLRDLVLRWARHVEERAAAAPLPPRAKRPPNAKLRVGILSSDLRSSSVARFLNPLMRGYDRERLEIFCYTPLRASGDPVQNEFIEIADKFTFVEGMAEREIAVTIQADDVDILLELNGFTKGNRIAALAYKPAPVQMLWFGYPFTSGLKSVDYLILDPFTLPEDESLLAEEAIVMPNNWICFGEFPEVEITEGIPADRFGRITFGTLNNPYKFTPKMIALWAEVMNRVADSRFLLVRGQARSFNLCKNLSQEFAKHGVSPERLYLFDNTQEKRNHLFYYNDIDISLDTFPLTGGTTTCEATWMGVPVVTLVGDNYHQRLSRSVLMNCGLDELCALTPEEFVDTAVALAGDRDKLLAWRHGFRDLIRQSPLCDSERFVDDFQTMLDQVAALHGLRRVPGVGTRTGQDTEQPARYPITI
ncbi:MAG: tetratricopeptide repeat protein [Proteobacteria bacterium]|nr:tetratricopeptide repeat protein [Pseudomonadota bacterium]